MKKKTSASSIYAGSVFESSASRKEHHYVKKNNEFFEIPVASIKFKETILQLFGDCEEIKKKIEDRTWKSADIKEIVFTYNEWLKAKSSK